MKKQYAYYEFNKTSSLFKIIENHNFFGNTRKYSVCATEN